MTNPKPRLCHVITRLDPGGSADSTLQIVAGLHDRGYSVDLVCGAGGLLPEAFTAEFARKQIPITRIVRLVRPIRPLDDLAALIGLYRHFRRGKYDLVHTHTSKAGILGRIAARLAGVPRVVHMPHGHIFYGYFSAPVTAFFVFLERLVMPFTHALLSLTEKEKAEYLERRIGPAAKIHPVFSGVDLAPYLSGHRSRAEMRRELGLGDADFVIGTVARLVPIKNHMLLVRAAAKICPHIPEMRFVFVGDGELRELIESEIAHLGLSNRFTITSWRSDIPDLLSAFDIFAMTSKNEGLGRAFIEAQATGIPVIGPRIGGVPEVMADGRTGYLFAPEDEDDLADKIMRLYHAKDRLPDMARECRQWVDPRFSLQVMLDKVNAIYGELGIWAKA